VLPAQSAYHDETDQSKQIYIQPRVASKSAVHSGRKYAVFNFTFTVSSIKLFGFKNMAESAAKFNRSFMAEQNLL